jgi:hypothetical protein
MNIQIGFEKQGESLEQQQIGFELVPNSGSGNPRITLSQDLPFNGGNYSASSILSVARAMSVSRSNTTTTFGGALTVDGKSVGNYEYRITSSSETIASGWTVSNWFSTTADTLSSWIVVKGNLTINTGVTFTPDFLRRKLFTVVYATGDITLNGTAAISMSQRGANHSGTGVSSGFTAAQDIRIATGSFTGTVQGTPGVTVVNPQVPAGGGSGGPAVSTPGNGVAGTAGTDGGTGGGGSGSLASGSGSFVSGAGSAGTSYSGGAGGGGQNGTVSQSDSGGINGGNGGRATGGLSASGGAGNNGGAGSTGGASNGSAGTGGTLIVICEGAFTGGNLNSLGMPGGVGTTRGGGSGGGSITLLYGSNPSGPTFNATGGEGGGNGGDGSYRKLALS